MNKSKGGDVTGWKRGGKGFARCKDDAEFMKNFDSKADRYQYGPDYFGKFNRVTENAQLEGDDV
jgi:hypothetical protein